MKLTLVLDQIDFIQHQSLHKLLIVSMFFQPADRLLQQIIELLGAINNEQRKVNISQHFPPLGDKPCLMMC